MTTRSDKFLQCLWSQVHKCKEKLRTLHEQFWSVGFCRESRVEGNMSRVEGKMSRVQKCRRFFFIIIYCLYFLLLLFKFFFVSKNIDFVYIQALSFLSKKPEFLGRFSITCIEQFTSVLYTIEYFHSVSSIHKISRFHFLVV